MNIEPLGDVVVVEMATEEKSDGGILLPESAQDGSIGVVTAAGPGKKLENGEIQQIDVQVGDTVVFFPGAGTKISIEGKEVLFVTEREIVAIVHP